MAMSMLPEGKPFTASPPATFCQVAQPSDLLVRSSLEVHVPPCKEEEGVVPAVPRWLWWMTWMWHPGNHMNSYDIDHSGVLNVMITYVIDHVHSHTDIIYQVTSECKDM